MGINQKVPTFQWYLLPHGHSFMLQVPTNHRYIYTRLRVHGTMSEETEIHTFGTIMNVRSHMQVAC
jgi:hypothetical protein